MLHVAVYNRNCKICSPLSKRKTSCFDVCGILRPYVNYARYHEMQAGRVRDAMLQCTALALPCTIEQGLLIPENIKPR